MNNALSASRGGRIDSLQAVRALAFLGIFVSHSELSSQLGAWGVSVFFVLSGFLMVFTYAGKELSTSPGDAFRFSVGKIRKLYLLHIVMMAVAIPWEIKKSGLETSAGAVGLWLIKIVSSVSLLQSWVPTWTVFGAFNGVAWFLSAMFFIYFVFPFILKRINSYTSIANAVKAIFVTYGLMIVFTFVTRNAVIISTYPDNCYWTAYTFPVLRLGDFILGCNLGWLYLNGNAQNKIGSAFATIAEIMTFVLIGISAYIYSSQKILIGQNWFRYTNLWIPTSLIIVWLFAVNKGKVSRVVTNKITIWIGNISPITFLIHGMVIIYVRVIFSHNVEKEMMAMISEMLSSVPTGALVNYMYKIARCIVAFAITIMASLLWRDVIEPKIKRCFSITIG